MKKSVITLLISTLTATGAFTAEFHVAIQGNDANRGTQEAPLRTIQHAADLAQPGDVITVHEGVYRERVNPPRGGLSDRKRIVYQAAPGDRVEIKGSEIITNWTKVRDNVWKATLPNSFFGGFNPYSDLIRGDWFDRRGRDHHTGAIYLNGDWLTEAANLEEVLMAEGAAPAWFTGANSGGALNSQLWFARVNADQTTIWAQFKGANPNTAHVEINVRKTVFYPDQPGRNFITVRGFTMRHAATPWAPPTAEQIGLMGTHWSRGWVIESNVISHSTCSGIALGKHGDEYDNTSANTAEGYVKTIERAHANAIPWTKENIGHHIVRNNVISHCEQAGIVGSLGAAFSTVAGNVIHDIHVRRLFSGAEMAGIKFHAAIDTVLRGNHIYRTCRGLWLDWMAQGTRVSGNLFHDNASEDLFLEVNHGPFMVDNNLFLSTTSLLDMSQGGAFVHNLFAGKIVSTEEPSRQTPYHRAHSTVVAGLSSIQGGDNRFYNNLFVGPGESAGQVAKNDNRHRRVSGYGLWVYDIREFPLRTGGNIYYGHSQMYAQETGADSQSKFDPNVNLAAEGDPFVLHFTPAPDLNQAQSEVVTSQLLGVARIPGLPYENADGSSLKIDTDYFGKKRSEMNPRPGPFANLEIQPLALKVWPLNETP